jgi:hypothetical protein
VQRELQRIEIPLFIFSAGVDPSGSGKEQRLLKGLLVRDR